MKRKPVSTLAEAKVRLSAIRARLQQEFEIDIYGIVGSFARNEPKDASDLDVVYNIIGQPSLFDLSGALIDIASETGRQVDLVDISTMPDRRQKFMMKDFVSL